MKRTVTAPELAELLGISERQVFRLTAEGVLPARDGRYDTAEAAVAYARHVGKDHEGRRARTQLAQTNARHKAMQTWRALGRLATLDEVKELGADLWAGAWQAHQLAAATYYHALTGLVDHATQLRVASEADMAMKAELILLRNAWDARMDGAAAQLADEGRLERLLVKLSEGSE